MQPLFHSATRELREIEPREKPAFATYLEMITAQQVLLGNQRQAVQVRGQQFATAVYLVKALGGGWRENPDRISRSN
jgi:outer membrane protein, multidrug efflux system